MSHGLGCPEVESTPRLSPLVTFGCARVLREGVTGDTTSNDPRRVYDDVTLTLGVDDNEEPGSPNPTNRPVLSRKGPRDRYFGVF